MADEHGSGQYREKKNYYQCSPHSFVVIAYARGLEPTGPLNVPAIIMGLCQARRNGRDHKQLVTDHSHSAAANRSTLWAPSAWMGPWPSLATWLPSEKLEALDAKRTSYPRVRNLTYHATTSS